MDAHSIDNALQNGSSFVVMDDGGVCTVKQSSEAPNVLQTPIKLGHYTIRMGDTYRRTFEVLSRCHQPLSNPKTPEGVSQSIAESIDNKLRKEGWMNFRYWNRGNDPFFQYTVRTGDTPSPQMIVGSLFGEGVVFLMTDDPKDNTKCATTEYINP